MNDKTVLFAQLPDGNYQALLEDMQKTMPIQDYEGKVELSTKVSEVIPSLKSRFKKSLLPEEFPKK